VAKFISHLYGGAAVSSVAAIAVYSLGWAGPRQTQVLFFLGVAGSLLPDIDSDSSKPLRAFSTLFGCLFGFLACFALIDRFPIAELALIGFLIFILVRYVIFGFLARYTVHRGIWHSWLAVAFVGLASTNVGFHYYGLTPWASWLAGFFVAGGYLTHLCQDELATVDLLGHRVRRSFGTALKPFGISSPWATVAMLAAVVGMAVSAPTVEPVLNASRKPDSPVQVSVAKTPRTDDWMGRLRSLLD